MIVRCDSQYFFQRGLAFERLVNASHAQGLHSFSNSLVLDHRRRCPLHNKAADGFGYRQRFDDRQPSEITATLATIAPAPAVKNSFSLWFNSEPVKISGSGINSSRQFVQILRTRRCAHVIKIELEIRNGSIPMSSRRVIAPAASLVCKVESTW